HRRLTSVLTSTVHVRRSSSALGGRLPSLTPGRLLLLGRAAPARAAAGAASRARLLAAAARCARGVGDLRGALLGHALLLQAFVLLLVLDVGTLRGHVVYLLLLLFLIISLPTSAHEHAFSRVPAVPNRRAVIV